MESLRKWRAELIVAVLAMLIVLASTLDLMPSLLGYAANMPGWTAALEVSDYVSWDWRHATGITIVSWLFWSILGLAVVSLVKRRFTFAVLSFAIVVSAGYYLGFRTTCFDASGGRYCSYRSWGPTTRVTFESAYMKSETWLKWYPPYTGTHTGELIRARLDLNGDKQWDTWLDHSASRLDIDVDGDQTPDRSLSLDFEGWEQSRAIRGF